MLDWKPATFKALSPMESDILTLLIRGWTTPLMALQEANCLSLSQRVGSLIAGGYNIEKGWRDTPTGKRVRQYRVKPEAVG